jgi:hypothetical protein
MFPIANLHELLAVPQHVNNFTVRLSSRPFVCQYWVQLKMFSNLLFVSRSLTPPTVTSAMLRDKCQKCEERKYVNINCMLLSHLRGPALPTKVVLSNVGVRSD